MKNLPIFCCIAFLPFSAGAQFTTVVDDSWPTGSLLPDQPLEASWHGTSSGSAIGVETGAMVLVSGTSGRAIHGAFTPTSLNVGDVLVARFTFNTPATVSDFRNGAFRIALLNSSGLNMAQNFSYSGSNPNPDLDLPLGYWMDFSVSQSESAWPVEDGVIQGPNISFRQSLEPRTSGRLLATTAGGWETLGSGGDPYLIMPLSTYTGQMSIERTGADSAILRGSLEADGVRLTFFREDVSGGIVDSFDVLAFAMLSNAFGSTNAADHPDNGIRFTNVNIAVIPEPSTYTLLFGAFGLALVLIRRRRK